MNRSRKAFTLLELLTVIGVILVLMTIAVIGFNHVGRSATVRTTGVALENAKGLIGEYETTSTVFTLLAGKMPGVDMSNPFPFAYGGTLGDVTAGGADRYGLAVQNTCYMMNILARLPHNKQAISQLPGKAMLLGPDGQALQGTAFTPPLPTTINPPMCLVDGWNNPIIFVPPAGLIVSIKNQGQTSGPAQQYLVRTSGMTKYTSNGNGPKLLPTDRPFWASAGPDGSFSNGDDNVYSFNY